MGSLCIGCNRWPSGSSENKTSVAWCLRLALYQSLAKFRRTVLQKLSNLPSIREMSSLDHCIVHTPFPRMALVGGAAFVLILTNTIQKSVVPIFTKDFFGKFEELCTFKSCGVNAKSRADNKIRPAFAEINMTIAF